MRLVDKIKEIEQYLLELEQIIPTNFEEYEGDFKTKAACERFFEKIIEAAVDLAFILIKEKGLRVPEDDKAAFDILAGNQTISSELAQKLKDAKGMRNIIAHEYGKVDDVIVFESITAELIHDVRKLLEGIK